jgi:hypothetical protein
MSMMRRARVIGTACHRCHGGDVASAALDASVTFESVSYPNRVWHWPFGSFCTVGGGFLVGSV